MPNYCNNTFKLQGPAEKVHKIYEHFKETDNLLEVLHPPPENMFRENLSVEEQKRLKEQGIPVYEHIDDWHNQNWGTKWDIVYGGLAKYREGDDYIITGEFSTAWAPPTKAYDEFIKNNPDCSIKAMYFEPGCAFCGIYMRAARPDFTDVEQEWEWGLESGRDTRSDIPSELMQAFDISSYWDSEEEEDDNE